MTTEYRHEFADRIAAGLARGRLRVGMRLTWAEVQHELGTTALPVRSINWAGKAEHPHAAWIVTTLDHPGNKLQRPDRLHGRTLCLSDENVEEATRRMLNSTARFPRHAFLRVEGTPVRFEYLGLARAVVPVASPAYPHWAVDPAD